MNRRREAGGRMSEFSELYRRAFGVTDKAMRSRLRHWHKTVGALPHPPGYFIPQARTIRSWATGNPGADSFEFCRAFLNSEIAHVVDPTAYGALLELFQPTDHSAFSRDFLSQAHGRDIWPLSIWKQHKERWPGFYRLVRYSTRTKQLVAEPVRLTRGPGLCLVLESLVVVSETGETSQFRGQAVPIGSQIWLSSVNQTGVASAAAAVRQSVFEVDIDAWMNGLYVRNAIRSTRPICSPAVLQRLYKGHGALDAPFSTCLENAHALGDREKLDSSILVAVEGLTAGGVFGAVADTDAHFENLQAACRTNGFPEHLAEKDEAVPLMPMQIASKPAPLSN